MSDIPTLAVEAREKGGKGTVRQVRRDGYVPGVVYGDGREPATIKILKKELEKAVNAGGFFTRLYELTLDDKRQNVLARDLQVHPVTDVALHVDFLRVSSATSLTISVPVVFINEEECEGLRRGGVLNVVRYEIEITCQADAIPESIICDLAGLEMNDSLHFSSVSLPEGAAPTITDRDFTIATIAAPSVIATQVTDGEEEGDITDQDAPAGGEEAAGDSKE